ncbi:hypothetical protein, partial [Streptomyces sp. NPDC089915]|uniref:hypothetical protein n=1 Tax=Streptomyces sp. NPDC089915 TaxID=3155186 RepID=UPI00342BF682
MSVMNSARRFGIATAAGCVLAFAPAVSFAAAGPASQNPSSHALSQTPGASQAAPAPRPDSGCSSFDNANRDRIYVGDCVIPGGYYVSSADGQVLLVMQGDGNLVLRAADGYRPLWSSHTVGSNYAKMQADGNFVVYTNDGRPLWATATQGFGNYLAIQADGNLVVYTSRGGLRRTCRAAGRGRRPGLVGVGR